MGVILELKTEKLNQNNSDCLQRRTITIHLISTHLHEQNSQEFTTGQRQSSAHYSGNNTLRIGQRFFFGVSAVALFWCGKGREA